MSDAKTPTQWIAALPKERRGEVERVHRLVRRTVPDLKPAVMGGMLGYGPFHYRYKTGREGDTAIVGLASRKHGISLYVLGWEDGEYLVERRGPRLGKADCGKVCIRFKRLEELDEKQLVALLRQAARSAQRTKSTMSA